MFLGWGNELVQNLAVEWSIRTLISRCQYPESCNCLIQVTIGVRFTGQLNQSNEKGAHLVGALDCAVIES